LSETLITPSKKDDNPWASLEKNKFQKLGPNAAPNSSPEIREKFPFLNLPGE